MDLVVLDHAALAQALAQVLVVVHRLALQAQAQAVDRAIILLVARLHLRLALQVQAEDQATILLVALLHLRLALQALVVDLIIILHVAHLPLADLAIAQALHLLLADLATAQVLHLLLVTQAQAVDRTIIQLPVRVLRRLILNSRNLLHVVLAIIQTQLAVLFHLLAQLRFLVVLVITQLQVQDTRPTNKFRTQFLFVEDMLMLLVSLFITRFVGRLHMTTTSM